MSTVSKVATKRVSKKQQKKTTEIKEVVPEVIVDNGFTESMKEDDRIEQEQQIKQETKQEIKEVPKKPVPVIFAKRNEITLFIVKETDFKGFRAPINNLISWIIKNNEEINSIVSKDSTNDDKIKQLDAVKEYFIKHKTECVEKFNEFTENFKTIKRVRKQKETKIKLEPGHYFILYKKEDKYTFACVRDKAVESNIKKHTKESYEHIETKKIDDSFDFKTKKEELKDIIENIVRNSFKIKEGKTVKDFMSFIN